jgi:hypothetical protein
MCYKLGWALRELTAKNEVRKMLNQMEEHQDDQEIVRIYFEKEQGFLFAYNYDTDEFIAQGNTRDSLLEAMVKRYPNTKFIVEKEVLENLS